MKKKRLKLTGKVLAGLVLFSGITSVPTKAIDVKPVVVDVNVANVKANVFEKDGHFYAKLVADREVANVVARITTESKAEFLIKRDVLKAGEEVVVELDLAAQVPTRKLPHTGVKKESFTTVNEVGGHTFKIAVRYEVATDEVKAQQKANNDLKNKVKEEKTETPTDVPSIADLAKKPAPTVVDPAPVAAPAKLEKPKTADNVKPSDKPAGLLNTPVTTTTPAPKNEPKTVMTSAPKQAEAPKTTETKAADPKQTTQPAVSTAREEQIKQAFLGKVAALRQVNNLPALTPNAALNVSSLKRSKDVSTSVIDSNIHGPNGTIQYETNAARAAGYANYILANIAITSDSGTPEQVAQQLFDILFKEIGNVVPAYPYGHRNTLLDETAKDVGAGVTIKNGQVYLVQHQSSNGAFNGTTPKAGKYLDGSNTVYLNGQPVR
ncbi:CAP domain-containing protein [Gemella sp.]